MLLSKKEHLFLRGDELPVAEHPEGAKVPSGVSPHWSRHTGVTIALESGTDPRYAQAQAGHASLAHHDDLRPQGHAQAA